MPGIRQVPDSGVEFVVEGEFAAECFDEGFSEFDGVTFDDDIKVVDGFTKQKVTHESTNDVAGHVHCGGLGGNARE